MTTVNACVQKQGEIFDDYSIPLDLVSQHQFALTFKGKTYT